MRDPRDGIDEARLYADPQMARRFRKALEDRGVLIGRAVLAPDDEGKRRPARVVGVALRYVQVEFEDGTRRLRPDQQVTYADPDGVGGNKRETK